MLGIYWESRGMQSQRMSVVIVGGRVGGGVAAPRPSVAVGMRIAAHPPADPDVVVEPSGSYLG